MEIDAALIAQQGKESCNAADSSAAATAPSATCSPSTARSARIHTPYRSTVNSGGDDPRRFHERHQHVRPLAAARPAAVLPHGGQLSDLRLAGTAQHAGSASGPDGRVGAHPEPQRPLLPKPPSPLLVSLELVHDHELGLLDPLDDQLGDPLPYGHHEGLARPSCTARPAARPGSRRRSGPASWSA